MRLFKRKSKNRTNKNLSLVLFFVFTMTTLITNISSAENKNPRLANYFLPWSITDEDVAKLAKWDLLILDMENQINNPEKIQRIRQLNPKIKILAYISSSEIRSQCDNDKIQLRCELLSKINDSYYLKNPQGQKLSFWPNTYLLNMSSAWKDMLLSFVKEKIYPSKLWDGVFYDNLWKDISWFDNGNIDIDNDGCVDDKNLIDAQWKSGMTELLQKTNMIDKNFLIVGNSVDDESLSALTNGRMFETFPTPWQKNGTWEDSIRPYIETLPKINETPNIYIINSNTENIGNQNDYQKMRFGFTSTLLGNGYFSFDYGDKNHGQTWWYDEYDINLGSAISNPKNLKNNTDLIQPSLWRRDFVNGVSIVNSTNQNQIYVFKNEIFEKIKGTQNTKTNDGEKINYINLRANDGVILLKTNQEIISDSYDNGAFVRIFNKLGDQERNGFFLTNNNFYGNIKIIILDIDSDENQEIITTQNGLLTIYDKNKNKLLDFYPYDKNFKGKINFSVADINNDGKNEIITGADVGGPHIRIFDFLGNVINQFFAYDKNLRGGVSVGVGDVNGDKKNEIITGIGKNNEPLVRVFDESGKMINEFFVYDKKFKGGVNVSIGDINGDGVNEIITAPKSNGGPHIRIFDFLGNVINQFFAYDKNLRGGFGIIANDIDGDTLDEILVSINNF